MVEPEQVQNCRMEVVHAESILLRFEPDVVRFSVHVSALCSRMVKILDGKARSPFDSAICDGGANDKTEQRGAVAGVGNGAGKSGTASSERVPSGRKPDLKNSCKGTIAPVGSGTRDAR